MFSTILAVLASFLFSKFCLGRTLNEVHIFNPWNRVSPSVILYLNMYFELILSKSENFAHEKFCELLIQKIHYNIQRIKFYMKTVLIIGNSHGSVTIPIFENIFLVNII